jgi:hypothetical protein
MVAVKQIAVTLVAVAAIATIQDHLVGNQCYDYDPMAVASFGSKARSHPLVEQH